MIPLDEAQLLVRDPAGDRPAADEPTEVDS